MKATSAIRLLLAFATLGAASAQAQLFRAYLTVDGNDANSCQISAPCRLLPRALDAVASGGEIWMLDSANYNVGPVSVGKSVSILAIPGAVGSIVATSSGPAVSVTAAGLKISLRNVSVGPLVGAVPLPVGTYGIHMTGASTLTVENSVIANLPNDGIRVMGAGTLRVVDTTLRANGGRGIVLGEGARAEITGARILDNTFGGVLAASGGIASSTTTASVSDSVISGVLGGGFGVSAATTATGAVTRVSVTRTTIRRASYALMSGVSGTGSAEVNVGGSMIVDNEFAWSQSGAGATVLSLGNNLMTGNGGTSGVKSPLAPL